MALAATAKQIDLFKNRFLEVGFGSGQIISKAGV